MRMKIAVGFVHTLIIMKILVLSCVLHISTFCVVLYLFKSCNICRILQNLKKHTVGWKVVTGAYFKVRSYFTRVSDFQLQSNFLMAESRYQLKSMNHFKVGITMP